LDDTMTITARFEDTHMLIGRVAFVLIFSVGQQLEAAAERVRAFAKLLVHRRGHHLALEAWITATVADGDPHLAGFAAGLRRDQAAVTAGLTLPYSSGAVEGTVNKIKMVKRKLFGALTSTCSAN
jgi:transposase